MSAFDVIGLGALNLDRLYRVERLVAEGEAAVEKAIISPGGSAANTIYALAKLGVASALLEQYRKNLAALRVEAIDTLVEWDRFGLLAFFYLFSANLANSLGDALGWRWGQSVIRRRWAKLVAERDGVSGA